MATTTPRKLFMFNLRKDLLMLKEIVAINPFGATGTWEEVLKNFNQSLIDYGLNVQEGAGCPSERTLTDRVAMLIQKFNKEELASLRASGTDEEVNERSELIREVKELKEESEIAANKRKNEKKQKDKEEEEKAKEIRRKAMESLAEGGDKQDKESKRASKRSAATSLLDYLKEKNDREIKLKEIDLNRAHERAIFELRLRDKELQIRERELALKEKELGRQKLDQ